MTTHVPDDAAVAGFHQRRDLGRPQEGRRTKTVGHEEDGKFGIAWSIVGIEELNAVVGQAVWHGLGVRAGSSDGTARVGAFQ